MIGGLVKDNYKIALKKLGKLKKKYNDTEESIIQLKADLDTVKNNIDSIMDTIEDTVKNAHTNKNTIKSSQTQKKKIRSIIDGHMKQLQEKQDEQTEINMIVNEQYQRLVELEEEIVILETTLRNFESRLPVIVGKLKSKKRKSKSKKKKLKKHVQKNKI